MNLPSFTLSQLLAFMVFVASTTSLLSTLCSDGIAWSSELLKYTESSIPVDFQDDRQHYLRGHLKGWESCRENFYISGKLALLSREHHHSQAVADGYRECEYQIRQLLNQYSNAQVRSKIESPKRSFAVPLLVIAHLSLFAVLVLGPPLERAEKK